jgi:hypothetical protein
MKAGGIPEKVVGAARPKWVSPKIVGFVATFRSLHAPRFAPEYHAIVAI